MSTQTRTVGAQVLVDLPLPVLEAWGALRRKAEGAMEQLRQKLVAEEVQDDPRHVLGRGAAGTLRYVLGSRWGEEAGDGLPAALCPPPAALRAVLPSTVWDVTAEVGRAAAQARAAGLRRLLVQLELGSCLYSARAVAELRASKPVWGEEAGLVRLRTGDRLQKAWLRQVQMGDARLELTSLPLTMVFELTRTGLRFQALALDPLGPSREHRKVRSLLSGIPQLAPGTEQESVRVWLGQELVVLERQDAFFKQFEVGGLPGVSEGSGSGKGGTAV